MPRQKKDGTPKKASATPKNPRASKAASDKPSKTKAPKSAAPAKVPKTPRATKVPKATRVPKPAAEALSPVRSRVPRKGETQMVAFVRDPNCIFTYWEVTPESVEEVKKHLMDEYSRSSMVLRLYRSAPSGEMELLQEIQVGPKEMNRYVRVRGSGAYQVEIAQKAPSGKVFVFARSNRLGIGVPAFPASSGKGDFLAGDVPSAFIDHVLEEGELEALEGPVPGISSAEAYRRDILRRKMDRYSASRIQ